MTKTQTISLFAAVLISLNVMIGTGLFVRTALLAHDAGPYGAFIYLMVGIILLPLIFTFANLLKFITVEHFLILQLRYILLPVLLHASVIL